MYLTQQPEAKELATRVRVDSQVSNRYLTTVRIAFRAKQRRFDDFEGLLDDSMVKPVQRAIIELSDEQDQPDLRLVDAGRGAGWRLAVDPARPGYQALIGGEGWAIEISLDELSQLSLCGRLRTNISPLPIS